MDKYSSGDYQHAVGKMVGEEVRDCVSSLITDLLQLSYDSQAVSDWNEELTNVTIQHIDNSEEIEECEDLINELHTENDDAVEEYEEIQEQIGYFNRSFAVQPDTIWDINLWDWCEYMIDHTNTIYAELIELKEREQSDLEEEQDNPNEAYEHWIVSDWFGRQLKERGEMVEGLYNLTIWGRCCTGQSILLDKVICDIYDDTHGE